MTRTYRTFVDTEGKPCAIGPAVAVRTSIYEVIHPDGTESLADEWDTPIDFDPPIKPKPQETTA